MVTIDISHSAKVSKFLPVPERGNLLSLIEEFNLHLKSKVKTEISFIFW